MPRTTAWLVKQGFEVNHKRVASIMRELGIEGESGRRRVRTTIVDKAATAAEDHVKRDFNPPAPDVTWCGDIERHEALSNRAVMKGHRHASVAADVLKLRAA